MPSDDSLKSIPVRFDADNGQLVFIDPCPWCGNKHVHGAGEPPYTKERLNRMLGHRGAHCRTSNRPKEGYTLVWTEQTIEEKDLADEGVQQAGRNIDQDAEKRFGGTHHPLTYLRSLVRQHGEAASEQMAKLVVKKWAAPRRNELWELIDYMDKLKPAQLQAWQSYLKHAK